MGLVSRSKAADLEVKRVTATINHIKPYRELEVIKPD